MVWQEKCSVIVMLTNTVEGGKVKCEQYWPESGSKSYGPFQVVMTDQQILPDYIVRSFTLTVSFIAFEREGNLKEFQLQ